jgi:hypothetical protein
VTSARGIVARGRLRRRLRRASPGLTTTRAILLATRSFTVTSPAVVVVLTPPRQEQVANALEEGAQGLSNTQLELLLAGPAGPLDSLRMMRLPETEASAPAEGFLL